MKSTHALGLLVLTVFAAGCGSSYGDVCDKYKSCVGGNDKDKQACIDNYEAQERVANDYGCGSQYSDFHSCVTNSSNYMCSNGGFSTKGCDNSKVAACEYSNSATKH
jgi:hypothetical protein